MKLKVIREGGFAAQVVQKQMDTNKLPKSLQASLDSFIKHNPGEWVSTNPNLRDGYLYTLQWTGEEKGKVQFDDSNIPKEIGEVLHFVLK